MVSTLPLLAATVLLGQTSDAPPVTASPNAKVNVYSNGNLVPYTDAQRFQVVGSGQLPPTESHHPILSKIRGLFGKRSSDNSTPPPPYENGTTTNKTYVAPTVPITNTPAATAPPPSTTTPPITTTPAPSAPSTPSAPAPSSSEFPRKMPTTQGATSSGDARVLSGPEAVQPATLKSLPTPVYSPILPVNAQRIGRDEKFAWVTGQLEIEKGQYVLYYATPETVDQYNGRVVLSTQKVDMHSLRNGDLVSVHGQLTAGHGTPVYHISSADLIERPKQ
jgi:hypothetical protein